MTDKKGYQGWTNYPTRCVHLWISNEEPLYRWDNLAQKILDEYERPTATAHLRDALKAHCETAMPTLEGMWSDLLTHVFEEVNWQEIADALLEDKHTEEEEEDDTV